MNDLIVGCASIALGCAGLTGLGWIRRKLPARNARMDVLRGMSVLDLHAELTRCLSAIMLCARKNDRRGMRHAYRAMRPVMKLLRQKETARAATRAVTPENGN